MQAGNEQNPCFFFNLPLGLIRSRARQRASWPLSLPRLGSPSRSWCMPSVVVWLMSQSLSWIKQSQAWAYVTKLYTCSFVGNPSLHLLSLSFLWTRRWGKPRLLDLIPASSAKALACVGYKGGRLFAFFWNALPSISNWAVTQFLLLVGDEVGIIRSAWSVIFAVWQYQSLQQQCIHPVTYLFSLS